MSISANKKGTRPQQATEKGAKFRGLAAICEGLIETTGNPPVEAGAANLRDAIERDVKWWSEGLTTDGADHFVIPH